MGKIRVEELAAQMGIGSKEVLFLLQSIGVDVKSPQAALDETTVLAILQGKTHAPKQLIVRDTESKAFRPQKSALSRIKIVEKPLAPAEEAEGSRPPAAERHERTPAESRAAHDAKSKTAEPARTAVVPSEPDAEAPKPLPRRIVLPPRPVPRERPSATVSSPHPPPRPAGPPPPPVRTGASSRATGFQRPATPSPPRGAAARPAPAPAPGRTSAAARAARSRRPVHRLQSPGRASPLRLPPDARRAGGPSPRRRASAARAAGA